MKEDKICNLGEKEKNPEKVGKKMKAVLVNGIDERIKGGKI